MNKPTLVVIILCLLFASFNSCNTTKQVVKKDTVIADYSKYQLVGPKKRIFVADFENRSTYGQHRLGKALSDIIITELSKTDLFILVEREKLNVVMKEHTLSQTGLITEASAPEIGLLLGANAILTGSVTQFGVRTQVVDNIIAASKKQVATCGLDVRIINVNTGVIAWAGSGEGEASRTYSQVLGSGSAGGYDETLEGDAFRAAVVRLMENMVTELNKMPWSCRVAKVSNTKIYLNAGIKSNLNLNTEIAFFNLGEPIVDPTSGLELGREETWVGDGKVISYLGEDASIAEIVSGDLPSESAVVKLKI